MSGTVGVVAPEVAALPFVDEHSLLVRAPASAVWDALGRSLPSTRAAQRYAALVGAEDQRPSGDPLAAGSVAPGFHVREADPPRRVVLVGRHRFSAYSLTFVLDEEAGGTRLSARTDARFPGVLGALYRAAVIRSGGHRVAVRRWLRRIARTAEARSPD